MGNRINNKYEYRSGLLDSLKVQHTASDVRNEDEYRKKVLNGLGVEYTDDDINQKSFYRAKVVEGLASSGGGGGGSSDFSTAEVTVGAGVVLQAPVVINEEEYQGIAMIGEAMEEEMIWQVPLYKGKCVCMVMDEGQHISVSGNITEIDGHTYHITGDCTITIINW